MHQYKLISRKGEGTFSEVLKAQSLKTGNYVAIKCMKTHFNSVEQVNKLREIQALRKLSPNPHIIKLLEVLYDEPTGRLALVFELMDMNLYELIKDRKKYLPHNKVRFYMFQLFKAIHHMHRKGIFHRDIKPENILLQGDVVKLADLGSCRGMFIEHPYTEYISTRWYRPPECLMTDGYYDHKMDIWGAGCVMFEIMTLVPLFPGNNEMDMIHRIHNIIGTPHPKVFERFKKHASHLEFNFPQKVGSGIDKLLSHVPKECADLIKQMLIYDPEERIAAEDILQHEYFRDLFEADRQKEFQTTLNSIRLSPHGSKLHSTQFTDKDRHPNSSTYSNYEKSPYHQTKKSTSKKPVNVANTSKLNLKVEGTSRIPFINDSSTDEDVDKTNTLPPLKQFSNVHLDTKYNPNLPYNSMRKKEETKRYANTILKPTLSNQHLAKKSKKSNMMYQAPEYIVFGKKAS